MLCRYLIWLSLGKIVNKNFLIFLRKSAKFKELSVYTMLKSLWLSRCYILRCLSIFTGVKIIGECVFSIISWPNIPWILYERINLILTTLIDIICQWLLMILWMPRKYSRKEARLYCSIWKIAWSFDRTIPNTKI